jgi:hypothetical protein
VFCGATSAVGPPVDADAPLASDSDNPAAPKTGTVLLRRFRFEACLARAISGSPILSFKKAVAQSLTVRAKHSTPGMEALASDRIVKFLQFVTVIPFCAA